MGHCTPNLPSTAAPTHNTRGLLVRPLACAASQSLCAPPYTTQQSSASLCCPSHAATGDSNISDSQRITIYSTGWTTLLDAKVPATFNQLANRLVGDVEGRGLALGL